MPNNAQPVSKNPCVLHSIHRKFSHFHATAQIPNTHGLLSIVKPPHIH